MTTRKQTREEKVQSVLGKIWQFVKNSAEDWTAWGNKLKWLFISFKVMAFFGFCALLVFLWFGLERAFQKIVEVATGLKSAGYIKEEGVVEIINTAQTVLYDNVVGHVSVLAVGVLVAIIGLKAVSDKIDGDLTKAGKGLKKYLKK